MSAPTDKELKKATAEVLQGCDIASTSLKAVRKQLEEKFNCSLAEQKEVIYKAFEKFLAKNEAVIQYKEIVDAEIKQEEALAEAEAAEEQEEDVTPAKKKSRGGFGADVHLAPDLADFLGTEVMPRTEVTKRIWAYIKEHELQDPSDKRLVVCDAALEKVLKRKTIHMFKMTKELSKMMMKPNEVNYGIEDEEESDADSPAKPTKKEKATTKTTKAKAAGKKENSKEGKKADTKDKKRKASDKEDTGKESKKLKKQSAYTISDKLQSLLGLTSDDTRYQVVAKMWEYIRGHDLQNPADKREVRLDKPLQDIFKVKTFTIFSMNKHLSSQIVKN